MPTRKYVVIQSFCAWNIYRIAKTDVGSWHVQVSALRSVWEIVINKQPSLIEVGCTDFIFLFFEDFPSETSL